MKLEDLDGVYASVKNNPHWNVLENFNLGERGKLRVLDKKLYFLSEIEIINTDINFKDPDFPYVTILEIEDLRYLKLESKEQIPIITTEEVRDIIGISSRNLFILKIENSDEILIEYEN